MSKNKHRSENQEKDLKKEIFPEEPTQEESIEKIDSECECQNKEECCKEECECQNDKQSTEEIATLNNQITILKEALLRNQAELQNYKRRK